MPQELSYEEEFKRQFGGGSEEPEGKEDAEPEVEEEEVEDSSGEEESQEPESVEEESSDSGEQEEKPAPKQKTQDDEYRAFIEGQPNKELKEQARKLVQGLKSQSGRTSALHRQLNAREQLIKQLYDQSSRRSEPSQVPTSSRPEGQDQKPPADELPEKFKALKEKNPEAAAIIDEVAKWRSNLTAKQIQEVIDSRLGKLEQKEKQTKATEEWNRVEERSKELFEPYGLTARDVVMSDDFRGWLEMQRVEHPGIYNLYEQANDADTAYLVLKQYEEDYQKAAKEAGLLDDENDDNVTTQNKGDEIRQRREKAKQSGTTVKPSRAGSPRKNRDNLSYEEEFKLVWGGK